MSCKHHVDIHWSHYSHVIIGAMASQITGLTIVYSTVYSGLDQWKYQSSASLASVRGVHRWPLNSPHKWPVTRKMFPFDDVIILSHTHTDSLNMACPNMRWTVNNTANVSSQLRTCVPEAIVKGSDKWLHPTDTVGFNFLFLSLILASGTSPQFTRNVFVWPNNHTLLYMVIFCVSRRMTFCFYSFCRMR